MSSAKIIPIPDLKYIQGNPVDFLGNGAYAVQLFATWCPPCMRSIPVLDQLVSQYPEVKFLGVTSEPIASMRRHPTCSYALASAGESASAKSAYSTLMSINGLRGIPHIFLIARGKVYFSGHPMDGDFEKRLGEVSQLQKDFALTADEVKALSPRALAQILARHGVSSAGLLEKSEYIERVLATLGLKDSTAESTSAAAGASTEAAGASE